MADKKEKPKGWNFDIVEDFILLLLFVALLTTFVPMLFKYLTSGELSFYGFKLSGVLNFFKNHTQFFRGLGFVLAGVGVIGTFIFNKKADAISAEERAKLFPNESQSTSSSGESTEIKKNEKWEKVIKDSESQNPSDWRLAIIEADIMLDELLDKLHLPGDTMGEKLKAVEKSDFTTIDLAWEAHKARNSIAHEGSDFLLNQRETRRIISLYESVFKEFYLI